MKKWLLSSCVALCAAFVNADTFVWTGAEDAYWTNKANWKVEVAGGGGGWTAASRAPSALVGADDTASWANFDADADTVTFSGDGNGHTTIDLDGVFCVSNIVVDGATAQYTFGTAGQDLSMRVKGSIQLTAGSTCAPAFGGRLLVGKGVVKGSGNTVYGTTTLRNDSTLTFSIPIVAFAVKYPGSGYATYLGVPTLYGNGPFRLAGDINDNQVKFYFYNYSKVTVDATITCFTYETFDVNSDKTPLEIEILAEKKFAASTSDNNVIYHRRPVNVSGAGTFALVGAKAGTAVPDAKSTYLKLNSYPLKVSSRFDVVRGNLMLFASSASDTPTLEFLPGADNVMTYDLYWWGCPFNVRTPSIGANGVKSALGCGSLISLARGGRLVYTGAGETTTRSLQLATANGETSVAGGALVHEGTGDWTVDSTIASVYGATATTPKLTLENSTEQALTLNSVLADGAAPLAFAKTGTGLVVLGGANTFTGAATAESGTLRFAAGGSADTAASWAFSKGIAVDFAAASAPVTKSLKGVTIDNSSVTLTVGANVTVSLDTLPTVTTGGSLDVTTADGGKFVCAAAAGQTVPYSVLRINHQPAAFDANGELMKNPCATTTTVDVRGGVIPNDATATVGIVDAGESGDITLGATATTVDTLVQGLEEDPATVALASGQTLSANILAVKAGATNLTVGADRTTGSFAVPNKGLLLDADSTNGELVVKTPLSASGTAYLTKLGAGLAEVSSAATAAFTARAQVYDGTLAYAADDTTRVTTEKPAGTSFAAYDAVNTASKLTLTTAEGGLVIGGTNTAAHPLGLSVPGGSSARITGADTMINASVFNVGSSAGGGSLTVDGGAKVNFDYCANAVGGEMAVSNATVTVTEGTKGDDYNVLRLGIKPANNVFVPGRLIVGEGGVLTNRVVIGYNAPGTMILDGGRAHLPSLGGKASYIGYSNHDGYLLVKSGTLSFLLYTWACFGNMLVTGGEVDLGNAFCLVPDGGSEQFHLRITGGTVYNVVATTTVGLKVGWNGGGDGVITLDGPTAVYSYPGNYKSMENKPSAGCAAIINLNAGTWNHHHITKHGEAAGKVFVNLNGGRIVASNSGNPLLNSVLDRVTVYENGVTIGMSTDITWQNINLGASVLAAPGKGVTGVKDFVPMTDRVTPPCVSIEGDGEGATAAPLFDEKTGTVTGIAITSHGWNYTWARVHLVTHYDTWGTRTDATYDCELADNVRGGLTLDAATSSQILALNKSNEFASVTAKCGTLNANVAGAIPEDADVVLCSGGTVNMSTNDLVFGSLSGTGGTLRGTLDADNKLAVTTANPGTGLSGVTFMSTTNDKLRTLKQTCNGAWNLDAAEIAAGKTVSVMGELIFGANATLTVTGDLTKLDETKKYTILEATAGSFTGVPTLTSPMDWKLKAVGSTLRLYKPKGMLLIVW